MDRRRSPSVVCRDGFVYKTRRVVNNLRYLVCTSNKLLGCTATAKITGVDQEAQFTLINAHHNHPIEENQTEAVEFKRQLREACIRHRGNLKNIYERVAARNAVGAVIVPYNSVRSSMLRWRQATTPNMEWNRSIPEDEEEPVLAVPPPNQGQYLQEPPPLVPILPVPTPLQPAPNEPPPLVYFRPPAPMVIQPVVIPDHAIPFPAVPSRSPSPPSNPPSPPHLFNFPPIPEEIGDLFAQLGDDPPVVRDVVHPWIPTIAVTEYDEATMPVMLRCNVCLRYRVQYVFGCGHLFCSMCACALFNAETSRCGICRTACNREPTPFYFT